MWLCQMVDVTVPERTGYVLASSGIRLCVWLFPEFPDNVTVLYPRLRMGMGSGGAGEGTL